MVPHITNQHPWKNSSRVVADWWYTVCHHIPLITILSRNYGRRSNNMGCIWNTFQPLRHWRRRSIPCSKKAEADTHKKWKTDKLTIPNQTECRSIQWASLSGESTSKVSHLCQSMLTSRLLCSPVRKWCIWEGAIPRVVKDSVSMKARGAIAYRTCRWRLIFSRVVFPTDFFRKRVLLLIV